MATTRLTEALRMLTGLLSAGGPGYGVPMSNLAIKAITPKTTRCGGALAGARLV